MDNSEKLSLFRKGNSNGIGFTDIEARPRLSLNKEVIANLNDQSPYKQIATNIANGTCYACHKSLNFCVSVNKETCHCPALSQQLGYSCFDCFQVATKADPYNPNYNCELTL